MAKPTATKVGVELVEFYGGKAIIEKKPWREHFSFRRQGEKETLLSVTRVTRKLDKSEVLMIWQKRLIADHIRRTIEESKTATFGRDEVLMIMEQAIEKPEAAKVEGGETGTLIHDFAHDFAKAKIEGLPSPTLDHLDEKIDSHAKAINGISAFLDWYNGNDVEFIGMEQLVYYNSFLAGHTPEGVTPIEFIGFEDLFARVNKMLADVDYKSSKGVYSEQQYQLSAYRHAVKSDAFRLEKADIVGEMEKIVNFNKVTGELITHDITIEESEKNWVAFLGLHAVAVREKQLSKYG